MDKPQASDSNRERGRRDRRRVKRFVSPDLSKMWGINIPDPNVIGKYSQYYFTTKKKRDLAFKNCDNGIKFDPKK